MVIKTSHLWSMERAAVKMVAWYTYTAAIPTWKTASLGLKGQSREIF
jgi:hypothetical protein